MNRKATDGSKGTLKRRHLGIAGLLTVLLQYGVGVKNDKKTEDLLREVTASQISAQANQLRVEIEQGFVKKSELQEVLSKIDAGLDRLNDKVQAVNSKASRIEGYLKLRPAFSSLEAPRNRSRQ